jgi:probable rRNA maturation factor
MNQFPSEGDFSFLEDDEEGADAFNPETGELLLGDIVICASRVISQAEAYGHSRKREYAFLITHSVLHLCGYDHMEEEERARMEEKQREILGRLGISR